MLLLKQMTGQTQIENNTTADVQLNKLYLWKYSCMINGTLISKSEYSEQGEANFTPLKKARQNFCSKQ